ncbi:hypothetical protein BDR26DRAFT_870512 [Obelidium mucronatum]|nr:hypothetical protein BDR26DRAFT_870512 [Obelidium mucronatum]
MGSITPSHDSESQTPPEQGGNRVIFQFALAESSALTHLVSGPAAVALIGDRSISDVIIQVSEGEFILANSSYLLRNAYFSARFGPSSNSTFTAPLKIHPPFPAEFRQLLNCIYANTQEYCSLRIVSSSFTPLFMNALSFKVDHVINACLVWFHENWRSTTKEDNFSSACINQATLSEKLLPEIQDNKDKLRVILAWAKDMKDSSAEDSSPQKIRKFVEESIDFAKISGSEWVDLLQEFGDGSVGVCVSSRVHILHLKEAFDKLKKFEGVHVQCGKCKVWVEVEEFCDEKVCCRVLTGDVFGTPDGSRRVAISDNHEHPGFKRDESNSKNDGKEKKSGYGFYFEKVKTAGWILIGMIVGGIVLFFSILI